MYIIPGKNVKKRRQPKITIAVFPLILGWFGPFYVVFWRFTSFLAILRRFLPLGIVFIPKTTATSFKDADFFQVWCTYIYMYVCQFPFIGLIQWIKQMKATGDNWNPCCGGDKMVEWSKALNFLRSNRCCTRIEYPQNVLNAIYCYKTVYCLVRYRDTAIHIFANWYRSKPWKKQVLNYANCAKGVSKALL